MNRKSVSSTPPPRKKFPSKLLALLLALSLSVSLALPAAAAIPAGVSEEPGWSEEISGEADESAQPDTPPDGEEPEEPAQPETPPDGEETEEPTQPETPPDGEETEEPTQPDTPPDGEEPEEPLQPETPPDGALAPAGDLELSGVPDAPAIPGYTQYTISELDPDRDYLIVAADWEGHVYALYGNDSGLTVGSGSLNAATDGFCGALLDLSAADPAATYLKDKTPLDMASLHFTAAKSGDGYTLAANGCYLALGGKLFSVESAPLTVSASRGQFTITSGDNRMLDFNRKGDEVSLYPDLITDFWGPTGKSGFPIYLYVEGDWTAPELPDPEYAEGAPEDGTTTGQPFAGGTAGSGNFRIPALVTLEDGTLLAAADARWNHAGDACALDTLVSRSEDGGETWQYSFANFFNDSTNAYDPHATAFIDPVMTVGKDGAVYLLVDLFPGGIGLNTAPAQPAASTGYADIGGVPRMMLFPFTSGQSDGNYTHYVGDFADGYAPVYDKGGAAEAVYYVDPYYYLYDTDRKPLYCAQLGSDKLVRQNVFFYNADLHVRGATYLWLIKSTDGGKTWSEPSILNPQIRKTAGTHQFYGVGPGAGLCLADGTIVLPCYTFTAKTTDSSQIASFIYSSDGGATWKRSDDATSGGHWSSESALVQLDDTTLRHFYRDGYATLYYTDHTWDADAGKWVAGTPVDTGAAKTYNNQLSAIRYSQPIDGKPAILVSTANGSGNSRSNGTIYTFTLNNDNSMELSYTFTVTTGSYGYSSLTELDDGSIGLLYEGGAIGYHHYDIREIADGALIGNQKVLTVPLYGARTETVQGAGPTGDELAAVDASLVTVTQKAEGGVTTITYAGLKEGTTQLTFGGVTRVLHVKAVDPTLISVMAGTAKSYRVKTDVITHQPDPAIATAEIQTEDHSQTVTGGQGNLGTDKNYNGNLVPMSRALYLFEGNNTDGFAVTAKTADGTTVYLNPTANSAGYPSSTSAKMITLSPGKAEGSFYLKDNSGNYLHFYRNGNNHFDRVNKTAGFEDACSFLLYRPAAEDETSSTEIPGYVRVTEAASVESGVRCLIVAAYDSAYYALYPSVSTSSKYVHVIKVDPDSAQTTETIEDIDRTLIITGVAPGTTDLVADGVFYRVTVTPKVTLDDAVFTLDAPVYLPKSDGSRPTGSVEVVDTLKECVNFTVTAQVATSAGDYNTIFSLTNGNSADSTYFLALYANGTALGWHLNGLPGGGEALWISGAYLRADGLNTIAIKFDSSDYVVKMFANGALVDTQQYDANTYPKLNTLSGLDTFTVGGRVTSPGTVTYPFNGLISELRAYSGALTDADLISYTAKTPATTPARPTAPTKEPVESDQPFRPGDDFGSQYFRIPALYTLQDGRVMAASDIRFGDMADSPDNIDTGIRFREDGSWGPKQLVNHFEDYSDSEGWVADTASFIDPALVQTNTGRIIIMVDAFPNGAGLMGRHAPGTGFYQPVKDGPSYLALTDATRELKVGWYVNDYYQWSEFHHYLKPNDNPADDGHDKYLVLAMEGDAPTGYTADGHFNLYDPDGAPLTVAQRDPDEQPTGRQVPMNLFYSDSKFKVYSTNYLWTVYSDDNGATWSDPILAGNQERNSAEDFLGVGPGRGYVVQNGPYKDRILFCVYDEDRQDSSPANEIASVVYSDDDGLTWHNGTRTSMAAENSPGKSSEAQIVELPDGTLRMFARSATGYIGYCDSADGGVTWTPMVQDLNLTYDGDSNGCQISVINYSQPIDGKPALILSCPGGPSRNNGIIRVGLIGGSAGGYTIEWKYRYAVNYGSYAYSCLTELPGGGVALLSEDGGKMNYREFTIDELKVTESAFERFSLSSSCTPGAGLTVTLERYDEIYADLSDLDHLTLSFPGSGLADVSLALSGVSADKKTMTFTGAFPAGSANRDFEISLPADQHLVTVNGFVTPSPYDKLTGRVTPYSGGDDGGSGGDDGGSGGTPSTKPGAGTTTNPDGSTTTTVTNPSTGAVTETTKRPDGSTTVVETAKDGTVTETASDKGGVKTETVTAPDGTVTSTAAIPDSAGGTVVLPMSPVTLDGGKGAQITVDAKGSEPVRVVIPVKDAGPGAVAMLVLPDGSTQVIPKSTLTEEGLSVPLAGGATIQIVDNAKDFADVAPTDWFSGAVAFASGHALFQGTGENSFSPGASMTRAMLVTVLYRLDEAEAEGGSAFADVEAGSWYANAAAWASGAGIVTGTGAGFDPDGSITRESLAVMLYRYAGHPEIATSAGSGLDAFQDGAQISSWAQDAMGWCVSAGILQGSGGSLNPGQSASRAEVSTVLMRLVDWLAR